ncbi:MAG: aminotransferase class I/II-fold pyridoxal phosphate-dependent enzyme [Beijerinckiaceae bacterium]
MAKNNSLADYANKRFRFAGKAVVDKWNPFCLPIDTLREEAEAQGRRFVSFANYDYLGLANHPLINAAAAAALETLGIGVLASRLVGGERSIHKRFENELAAFLGVESVLTLVSGYLTNVTVISHIMGSHDGIFLDELSHNSIVSGAKSTIADNVVFRHNDLDHLEFLLREKRDSYRKALIVVESLYSMDGDIVDLPRLIEIKERHNCWLLVDEAHSIGVLGQDGRGLCEFAGVDPNQVDLIIGTLSKTFTSCGGFVAGKAAVIDWLRLTVPGFVYSVGLSPVIAAAAQSALQLLKKEPWRIEKLRRNAELFVELAQEAGLDTGPAIGRAVVPIIFRDTEETVVAWRHLMNHGYYVPPIVKIGVPRDQPRLRFFISAAHSEADIRGVIGLLARREQPHAVSAQSLSAAT